MKMLMVLTSRNLLGNTGSKPAFGLGSYSPQRRRLLRLLLQSTPALAQPGRLLQRERCRM